MKKFIEISSGLWYDQETGKPWSTMVSGSRNRRTDGELHEIQPHCNGYYMVYRQDKHVYWHVLVWNYFYGQYDATVYDIDHVNNDRLNNRLDNLQLISHKNNCRKCLKYKNNSSGFKGVSFYKRKNMWVAGIRVDGRRKHIGYFDDPKEAAKEYDKAAKEFFGSFSLTNEKLGLIN